MNRVLKLTQIFDLFIAILNGLFGLIEIASFKTPVVEPVLKGEVNIFKIQLASVKEWINQRAYENSDENDQRDDEDRYTCW